MSSKIKSGIKNVLSLLIPPLCSVLAFFFADNISLFFFSKNASSKFEAFCVFASLFISTAIMILLTRVIFVTRKKHSIIEDVLEP